MARFVIIQLKNVFRWTRLIYLDHKTLNSLFYFLHDLGVVSPTHDICIIAQTSHAKRLWDGSRLIRHPRNLWLAFIGLRRSFFPNRVLRHRLKILVFVLWVECPSSEYRLYFSLSTSSLYCYHRGKSVKKIIDFESGLIRAVVTVHFIVYLQNIDKSVYDCMVRLCSNFTFFY